MVDRLQPFARCNLFELEKERVVAHGGEGQIQWARPVTKANCEGALNFIDTAVLEPGVSIGKHCHAADEEEYYLVLSGQGTMTCNGETFRVGKGDLIRNPPQGTHQLINDGHETLNLFVFEVKVPL